MIKIKKTKKSSYNIGIIGVGWVGLITAASLADLGNKVRCFDVDSKRMNNLQKGSWLPFYEPHLKQLVDKNLKAGRLSFYINLEHVVENSQVIFICVGTPSRKNGSVDLSYIKNACQDIAKYTNESKIIVIKSTVPTGTAEIVSKIFKRYYKGQTDIVSNPEFLQEGRAVESFLKADRIVIGYPGLCKPATKKIMKDIYSPLKVSIFETNNRTAEMSKYASNVFLATEISFINNIANLCDETGADVKIISDIMKADKRIGYKAFLNAGAGYGGLCFPKDMRGFIRAYERNGYDPTFLKMVEKINLSQRTIIVKKIRKALGKLKGKTIVILGISFKPNTDDIRDAPSLTVIEKLLSAGAQVRLCDPVALHNAKAVFNNRVTYNFETYEALKGAHAAVLITEWDRYKNIDFMRARKLMKKNIIIDGRNIYDPLKLKKAGFKYYGIGRNN
ncbi:UDP-glucose/GDP-mannose dehydrogenase family protein [Patescibacteria group bacterium]|nr:UDP-glucose/GDP-mannose dehydrogenase family protein [Patescibacteria group bacterium]MBU0963419.1 UDP-glucose/GDP-mannose dehydrogenase family protein [Patescibacteria group bacterium]